MSDNYPSDVKLDENPDGSVSFATGVVETIAGLAAQEVEGVASMAGGSSGFADMFSRKSSRSFTKGVRVDIDGNMVAVNITIIVEYGSPVPDIARSIQENVKKAIETMSGLDVRNVDVHVQGVSFEREHRAAQELREHQQKLLEKSQQEKEQAQAAQDEAAQAEEIIPAEDLVDDIEDDLDEDIDDLEQDDLEQDDLEQKESDDLPAQEDAAGREDE